MENHNVVLMTRKHRHSPGNSGVERRSGASKFAVSGAMLIPEMTLEHSWHRCATARWVHYQGGSKLATAVHGTRLI